MFPPTCYYILSVCTNRYPDHPPLMVKGLYYKVAIKDNKIVAIKDNKI